MEQDVFRLSIFILWIWVDDKRHMLFVFGLSCVEWSVAGNGRLEVSVEEPGGASVDCWANRPF